MQEPRPGMLVILQGNAGPKHATIEQVVDKAKGIVHLSVDERAENETTKRPDGKEVFKPSDVASAPFRVHYAERDESKDPKPGTWKLPPLPKLDPPKPAAPATAETPKGDAKPPKG